MVERICKNCRFCFLSSLHKKTEGEHSEHECHRRSPGYSHLMCLAIWPIIELDMSCGEFKAKGTAHV